MVESDVLDRNEDGSRPDWDSGRRGVLLTFRTPPIWWGRGIGRYRGVTGSHL